MPEIQLTVDNLGSWAAKPNGPGGEATLVENISNLVDSFEDADIAEYSGDTGSFAIDDTVAYDGSYSLRGDQGGASEAMIYSTTGLTYYPEPGDTYRTNFGNLTEAINGNLKLPFGLQDTNNYYYIWIASGSEGFGLRKVSAGSDSQLAKTAHTYATGTEYIPEVVWGTDGTLDATLYDANMNVITTASATDTEFGAGGIGWLVYNNGANFDNARVV